MVGESVWVVVVEELPVVEVGGVVELRLPEFVPEDEPPPPPTTMRGGFDYTKNRSGPVKRAREHRKDLRSLVANLSPCWYHCYFRQRN
jgi:hypothetical protein